jgi:hypothetical protein
VLNAFERKVLRKISAAVLANGQWRNRYKQESYILFKEMELARNIRWRRLQRVGSFDEDEGREGAQGSTERIHRRERTRWEAAEGDVYIQWTETVSGHLNT